MLRTAGISTYYRLVTLISLLLTSALYGYLSKASLSYSVCNMAPFNDTGIQNPDVATETVTTRNLFKICFTSILVVLLAVQTASHYPNLSVILNYIWKDLRYVLCGMYWSGVFLWVVKLRVGRLRPCFVDGCIINPEYLNIDFIPDPISCANPKFHYYCQSFFSGHTMLAFYSFVYLVKFIHAKNVRFNYIFSFIFMSLAALVGYSRIIDYQHHLSDVIVGAMVGTGFSIVSFHIAQSE